MTGLHVKFITRWSILWRAPSPSSRMSNASLFLSTRPRD